MFDEAEFPDAIDWLSEEKYNLMKEKYNNMPKKKKKKAKSKKKKRKQLGCGIRIGFFI